MGSVTCQHCRLAEANCPRRLCATCYKVPHIRNRYAVEVETQAATSPAAEIVPTYTIRPKAVELVKRGLAGPAVEPVPTDAEPEIVRPALNVRPAVTVGVAKTCRHCKRDKVNRPRGLCWTCYFTPGVLAQYRSTSKYAFRGHGNVHGPRPLPAEPTQARPGSEAKILVLEGRAERGEQMHHPRDAKSAITVRELAAMGRAA